MYLFHESINRRAVDNTIDYQNRETKTFALKHYDLTASVSIPFNPIKISDSLNSNT